MNLIRWAAAVAMLSVAAACTSSAPTAAPTSSPGSPLPSVPATLANTAAPTSATAAFATPEDAARAYIEGIRTADVDQILATSAVEEAAANFDFSAQADRLKVMSRS